MKKILFILRDCEHGGIPRVLKNLLDSIVTDKIEVFLYVCNPVGIFYNNMNNCTLLESNFLLRMLCCNYRKEQGLIKMVAILFKVLRHILIQIFKYDLLAYAEKCVSVQLEKRFDVVWACSDDVPAKIIEGICGEEKKILWIHNNYASIFETLSRGVLPDFTKFNRIVCVSNSMARIFKDIIWKKMSIDVSGYVVALHNIVNQEEILDKSKPFPLEYAEPSKNGDYILVSVGRLAYEKNFESIPDIVSRLKKDGFNNVKWYIVGDGAPVMWQAIESKIFKSQVNNEVTLLGIKSNPYPYIAYSNMLVLTSLHEAYPTVINEAKALGIPVLSSPFEGVQEIVSQDDGWICDVTSMAEKIENLISKGKLAKRREPIDFYQYNQRIMNHFYDIVLS